MCAAVKKVKQPGDSKPSSRQNSSRSPASARGKAKKTKKTSPRGIEATIYEEETGEVAVTQLTEVLLAEAFSKSPLGEDVLAPEYAPAAAPAAPVAAPMAAPTYLAAEADNNASMYALPTAEDAQTKQLQRCANCTFHHSAMAAACPRCGVSAAAMTRGLGATAEAETEAAEAQCLVALTVALNRAMVPANRRVKQVPIYPGD